MNLFEPNPGVPMLPGQGFNSFTQDAMATAIVGSDVVQPNGAGGQTVVYEFRQIEDASMLRKSLNLSASASLTAGIGSGSAKASFFNSIDVSSYALYVYVHVRVSNATHVLRDYQLTDKAVADLKEYGKDAFFDKYGDEFVSGYTTGGEFIAILQINNRTVQEKTQAEASMKGSYGAFSGSASFSRALETLNQHSTTQVYVMRRGGSGDVPDASNLKAAALAFPETVREDTNNAILLQVSTIPYMLATNRPGNMALVNLEAQRLILDRVAEQRETARVARADYRFAAENPYYFFNPDVQALHAAAAACDLAINQIDASVRACLLVKGRDFSDPQVTVPRVTLDWTIPIDVPLSVMVHEEGNGDTWGGAHRFVGTRGESRRIEGISIAISPPVPGLYIGYFVHGANYGDSAWTRDGGYAGTRDQELSVQGFQVHLLGPLAPLFDVVYLGHFEQIGDQQAQNDVFCGTRGEGLKCEGIQVSVTRK